MAGKELVDLSILEPAASIFGSTILTLLGVAAEWNSVQFIQHQELTVGVWLGFIGSIALYLGVVELGWREVILKS